MLPEMWTRLSQIALLCIILSMPFLTKKVEEEGEKKSAMEFLEEAIQREEEKEFGRENTGESYLANYQTHPTLGKANSEADIFNQNNGPD